MKPNWPTKKLAKSKDFLRSLWNKWYLFPLLILIVIPAFYSYSRGLDINYWDGTIGNWLATMLGIIGGIPIAFEINKFITRQEEKRKLKEAKEENREILSLIKQELVFNLDRLKDRESDPNNLPPHPYQIDVWETFSDSGQISKIINSQVLNRIASAYSIIKIERFIEQNCYLATRGAFAYSGTERATKLLLEDGRRFDKQLRENTEYAIREIDKELKQK